METCGQIQTKKSHLVNGIMLPKLLIIIVKPLLLEIEMVNFLKIK